MQENKIIELKRMLSEYAALVEAMLAKGIRAFKENDRLALLEIIRKDEPRTNLKETELDEAGATLIAQFGPKAKDLRIVLMILKMNSDLERIADHIVNIAESIIYLLEKPRDEETEAMIRTMQDTVMGMLKGSILAFLDEDTAGAVRICERDKEVNALRDRIVEHVAGLMGAPGADIERYLQMVRISSNLERIADLTKNICEDIMFMVAGKVIKHHKPEAAE